MLQVKATILLIFLSMLVHGTTSVKDSLSIEWLMEDAFKEKMLPLHEPNITRPEEVNKALEYYHAGEFRRAAFIFQKLRMLMLPDERQDFITFALAESYREMDIKKIAMDDYQYIIDNFAQSDKIAPAYFRLLQFAVDDENLDAADTLHRVFESRFKEHPLYNSALYATGKLHYRLNRYNEALEVLKLVPKKSSRYLQAQFLSAICQVKMKNWKEALMKLEYVRKNSNNEDLVTEAGIVIGDIYFHQDNVEAALRHYQNVPKNAKRSQYAYVKTAHATLDLGDHAGARDMAKSFMKKYPDSDYFFEMASILEQSLEKLGNTKEAAQVSTMIHRQILDARLTFEMYDEIGLLADLMNGWQVIEYEAIRLGDKELLQLAHDKMSQVRKLENKVQDMIASRNRGENKKKAYQVTHLAERRYLGLLKNRIVSYEDSLADTKGMLRLHAAQKEDSSGSETIDSLSERFEEYKTELSEVEYEYDLIVKECMEGGVENRKAEEEIQAKFVDWSFMRYVSKKEDLKKMSMELSAQKRDTTKTDTLKKRGKEVVKIFTGLDRDRLEKTLVEDRGRLITHIETMLDVYPKNRYNAGILFRLAELHVDDAGDEFQKKLRAYEKKLAESQDSVELEFPEYNLDKVLETYDRIIENYPKNEMTDDAYFYKALAFQKLGESDSANEVLLTLIEKFPESEYYVEANMNIGRYYFEHPKAEGGKGYRLAEEAYRRVLFYRDHPQYVQALYHLGWCYYMQDQYEEAIAVFKYLVEEVELEFDPSKMEEQQVVNPLLRGEAIDYIAISFDEEDRIEDAIQFLDLIGNNDYSAMVLKRIGELREEDLDVPAAIKIYRRLLKEYPSSSIAPDATVGLIKLYESNDNMQAAMQEREVFFSTYSKGSEWWNDIAKRDSTLLPRIDSMAIAIGLYVADASYRAAEETGDTEQFIKAAKNYSRVLEKYPDNPRAADARWNVAVIMDTKMNEKPKAFEEFINFSRQTEIDSSRREQAALNAVAIAQQLLPPDSALEDGKLEFAAKKVIDAVENYENIFPAGSSLTKVQLGLGAIYFNRRMYDKAAKVYQKIIEREQEQGTEDYYVALSYLGRCHFGKERWAKASSVFKKVWKDAPDTSLSSDAQSLLLQSEFSHAKEILSDGDYEKAAMAFQSIEEKYPGSKYGDIVLFNAAGAWEKKGLWASACENYEKLVSRYPQSKLAPDALFNAAGDYEKANKYQKAADSYERIVANYSETEKAKDALFNLGFSYEKLGQMEKMAEANERYSQLYPGEKDVEAMLLRSANYYFKSGMYDRAKNVYRNFFGRFPRSSNSVEALFMVAKSSYEQGDYTLALSGFEETEMHNNKLIQDGLEPNNYYAAEAAYYTAVIRREQFQKIELVLPKSRLEKSLKDKTELLSQATKAYQRVITYQSEKMFEATYRMGSLYEDLVETWRNQQRPKLDPIKAAVLEKDINTLSSSLLQKSFIPYKKALEIGAEFDSLKSEQAIWLKKSKNSLATNYFVAGQYLSNAVRAMNEAPVPKEIESKVLHYWQYQKQLLETLEPMKIQVRDYFLFAVRELDSLNMEAEEVEKCRDGFARANFLIGAGYEQLSNKIIKNTESLPKNLSDSEREELLFQLEDIVFELQDKSLFALEDALERAKKHGFDDNRWTGKIVESLARLNPDKYGKSVFETMVSVSDESWIVRTDSVDNWCTADVPKDGWQKVVPSKKMKPPKFPVGKPATIADAAGNPRVFFWKHLFLNGTPRDVSVYVTTPGKYWLYINGVLTVKDTIDNRSFGVIDSAINIGTLVKGGDNIIGIEVATPQTDPAAVCVAFTALLDTNKRYKSSIRLPKGADAPVVKKKTKKKEEKVTDKKAGGKEEKVAKGSEKDKKGGDAPLDDQPTRAEIMKEISTYRKQEQQKINQIRRERFTIRRMKLEEEKLDQKIEKLKAEIEALKKQQEKEK